ncbi:MAG: hypothetical protein V7K88_04100 [Nostoc sp.]|uniref:hypothetical protein n=1 Tax=Nostoc sp. TaxID=1180 RepID=UPI002FF48B84
MHSSLERSQTILLPLPDNNPPPYESNVIFCISGLNSPVGRDAIAIVCFEMALQCIFLHFSRPRVDPGSVLNQGLIFCDHKQGIY